MPFCWILTKAVEAKRRSQLQSDSTAVALELYAKQERNLPLAQPAAGRRERAGRCAVAWRALVTLRSAAVCGWDLGGGAPHITPWTDDLTPATRAHRHHPATMATLALAKTLRDSDLNGCPSPPPPPRDGPGGSTRFFGTRSLERPGHLPSGLFDALASIACQDGGRGNRKVPAGRDVKYWNGATNPTTGAAEPWRNGTTDSAITDLEVIAGEQVR